MLSGQLWALGRSEPIIGGTGYGLLPTPVANDDNKSPEAHLAMKQRMKGGPRYQITSLQLAAKAGLLPTPRAEDSEQAGGHRGTPDSLTSAARLLPTPAVSNPGQGDPKDPKRGKKLEWAARQLLPSPNASDAMGGRTSKGSKRPNEGGLRSALLPTPKNSDHRIGMAERYGTGQRRSNLNDATTAAQDKPTGALNPDFVTWMMGWPIRWLHLPAPTGGPRGRRDRASRPSPPESPSEPTSSAPSETAGCLTWRLTLLDAFRRGWMARAKRDPKGLST